MEVSLPLVPNLLLLVNFFREFPYRLNTYIVECWVGVMYRSIWGRVAVSFFFEFVFIRIGRFSFELCLFTVCRRHSFVFVLFYIKTGEKTTFTLKSQSMYIFLFFVYILNL